MTRPMQTIVFPNGALFIHETPGHDGVFVWREARTNEAVLHGTRWPAMCVPTAVPPANIRTMQCPACDYVENFWALHTPYPNQCVACWHQYAVLAVPVEHWNRVRPYVHEGNPWAKTTYKPTIPAYPGASLYEEIVADEDESVPSTSNQIVITHATNTTDIAIINVQDSDGSIVWL